MEFDIFFENIPLSLENIYLNLSPLSFSNTLMAKMLRLGKIKKTNFALLDPITYLGRASKDEKKEK